MYGRYVWQMYVDVVCMHCISHVYTHVEFWYAPSTPFLVHRYIYIHLLAYIVCDEEREVCVCVCVCVYRVRVATTHEVCVYCVVVAVADSYLDYLWRRRKCIDAWSYVLHCSSIRFFFFFFFFFFLRHSCLCLTFFHPPLHSTFSVYCHVLIRRY